MKNSILFYYVLGVSLLFSLFGCSAPSIQQPTLVPPAATSTVTTVPPTVSPSMETIWKTNGSPDALKLPTELAVDSQGNVYVIDGDNHRVQKFDKDGNFVLSWGGLGAMDGKFLFHTNPDGFYGAITVDENDDVYVGDHHNRIQKFDSNGTFLMKFGGTGYDDGEFAVLGGGLPWIARETFLPRTGAKITSRNSIAKEHSCSNGMYQAATLAEPRFPIKWYWIRREEFIFPMQVGAVFKYSMTRGIC